MEQGRALFKPRLFCFLTDIYAADLASDSSGRVSRHGVCTSRQSNSMAKPVLKIDVLMKAAMLVPK